MYVREGKGGYISLIYERETKGEGRDKKESLLQKKKPCINKNTICSTVQGQDELSQIKKKRGRTGQEGEGIQCTFIQYFFLQRLLVETL